MEFIELSERFILRSLRRNPAAYEGTCIKTTGVNHPSQADDDSVSDDSAPKPKKSKTGNGYKHFLHEVTRGDPRGCAQKGLHAQYLALSPEETARHERAGAMAKEAAKLTGRGYAMTKRETEVALRQTSAQDKLQAIRDGGQLCVSETSGLKALTSLNLRDDTDFDDGIRAIKSRMRDVAQTESVLQSLQTEALDNHDKASREPGWSIGGLPLRWQPFLVTGGVLCHMRLRAPWCMLEAVFLA